MLPRQKRVRDRVNLTVGVEREVADLYRCGKENGWDVSEILRQKMSETLRALSETLRQNSQQYEIDHRPPAA